MIPQDFLTNNKKNEPRKFPILNFTVIFESIGDIENWIREFKYYKC